MNNLDYDSNTGTNLKTSGKNITRELTKKYINIYFAY